MCGLKFWTRRQTSLSWDLSSSASRRCVFDSSSAFTPRSRSEYISASTVASGTRSIIGVLKCNFVLEVLRARLAGRGRLVLLRLDRQAQIFLAALLGGAHPAREPVLGALNVERAAVVALLVVVRGLIIVAKQRAFVCVVVFHFRFSSAQDDRRRRCAEAPGRFLDESFDGGRMRVHSAALSFSAAAHTAFAAAGAAGYKPTCAVSAGSGVIVMVSAGTGAYRLIAMRSTTRLSSVTTIALIVSSAALM